MKLSDIREFFWPLLEGNPDPIKEDFTLEKIVVKDANLGTTYNLALKYYESEQDRSNTVESKSTIFVGTLGIVTAIIIAVTERIISLKTITFDILTFSSIFTLLLIILYLCRAEWFAIKVLARKNYHMISYSDFLTDKEDAEYLRRLILAIINKTRKNSIVINEKVDYMTMAQEYFKRGIISILIFAILLCLDIFIVRDVNLNLLINNLNNYSAQIGFNSWILLSVYGLIFIGFILIAIIFKKIKTIY